MHHQRLTDAQSHQFERYLALLQQWAPRVNLVGDASEDVVRQRHFAESITIGAALREREIMRPTSSIIDVGAGAGFPGVPMKIVWPDLRVTLLEATAKKTAFLTALVEELSLENVRVVTARAEDAAHDPSLRAAFDLVFARAVAPLAALVELTLPFARIGGRVVAPKGSRLNDELASARHALEVLGGKPFVVPLAVPGPPQQLTIILKQRETPAEYPRRSGQPRKNPL